MRIATFNINGVKARAEALPAWLGEASPDVVLLQEIKSQDEGFPSHLFEDLGYSVATHGQKGFNGVAILSKFPLEDVRRGLPGDDGDEQARWIEATVVGKTALRLCGLYLPNGNPAPGPKYDYKLDWMDRLADHARELLALEERLVLVGDYNVIPTEDDVHDPAVWADDALFLPATRAKYHALLNLGLTSAYEQADGRPHQYTFWDYQGGAWPKNHGIRIDHHLLSAEAADALSGITIHKDARSMDKPSDHVPVVIELRD